MSEYYFKMPRFGLQGEEIQKVQVKTYAPNPPHNGWVAHIQSTCPPHFVLDIGQNLHFMDEPLLLAELVTHYGLVQE